ncbi:MAG: hypothetical protein IPG82_19675 [Saprospiraceae bacterium]|nr:hypothetical protein [Saprospiraceae bacterium]
MVWPVWITPDTQDWKELPQDVCRGDDNFYDNEIVELAKSRGIFGLQLDEKSIGSNNTYRSSAHQ